MEEPGQGSPHSEVIVQDEVKSPLRRVVEDTITVVCWGIYLYLLLPMFTLVLWIFGIQTIFDQIIGEKGYEELMRLLANGGITTLVIFLLVTGWTYYNYLWFMRRGERRGNQVRISSDVEMSALLETDITAMEEIRNARRMEIRVEGSKYRITAKD
ncbi:MAG TPA: poly-beta-1,6-N-acetyl-D-glucosamine biosynthesis protein PgaD [Syntrophales bacterium]|nr:poly-beta-1,6-N-acetyl-D-glucosamine biosynthesis protein PgaD [Syntrophales bacterium]